MDQVDTEGCAGETAGIFVYQSRPNHSLTRIQERYVFWSLAGVCLAAPIGFALLGYWLILPFAGLEIGLLAWILKDIRGHEGDYEMLTIEDDMVVLEWRGRELRERRVMSRQWARVLCDCRLPGRNCRLRLISHGRETEIGHYLGDEGRVQLAARLRDRLSASR